MRAISGAEFLQAGAVKGLNHECSFAKEILFNFAILNVSGIRLLSFLMWTRFKGVGIGRMEGRVAGGWEGRGGLLGGGGCGWKV